MKWLHVLQKRERERKKMARTMQTIEKLAGEVDSDAKKGKHYAREHNANAKANVNTKANTDAEVLITRLYYGGRSFLIRLPTNTVRKLGLRPMDLVKVTVERGREFGEG
ncbi:MAG: hypothetical protein QXS27_07705 [Candidatus Jordarchaeaceae archaeon]